MQGTPVQPAQDLVKVAGEGSELDMLGAGHMQFAQLGGIELLVADDLCGFNSSVSIEQVCIANAFMVKTVFVTYMHTNSVN